MKTTRDPREIITPAAFTVAPDLLGLPLARPWRRGLAIMIDLSLAGVLIALLELPSIFLSAVAAVIFFRLIRKRGGNPSALHRTLGCGMRALLAMILFGISVAVLGQIRGVFRGFGPDDDPKGVPGQVRVQMSLLDAGLTTAEGVALFTASSPEEAKEVADRIRDRLVAAGVGSEEAREIRAALAEVTAGAPNAGGRLVGLDALRRSLAELDTLGADVDEAAPGPDVDSLATAYATALSAGDSARVAELRPVLAEALAGDRIAELEARNTRLSQRVTDLRAQNEKLVDRGVSVRATLRRLFEDLGLGFGWLMLYFTAFPVLWRGYTPGKRMLGIRVIRLDGRPIGWWTATERFAGYSASLATGLLGFVQVFWDRNRQTIHDKVASTVVVYERGSRRILVGEEAGGGAEAAADGALDGRRDEVVAGDGEPGGQEAGVEAAEMPEIAGVEESAAGGEAIELGPENVPAQAGERPLEGG